MLVDNLGVHRTERVRARAKECRIEMVFNGSYSSTFNPIERLWAWSKARFQKRCIDNAPYHLQHRMRALVEEVVMQDYSVGLRKRIATCVQAMRDYLHDECGAP